MSAAVSSAEVDVVLYDGNALEFATPPDVVAFANTAHTAPPSEFQISTSGTIWRYFQWIALMREGSWVEAETTVETTTVGIQFWGDTNDGWARVLVDGSEVWTGNTYGSDASYPGGAFVKYLEISGLDRSTHTIRVENMGINGPGGGNHVTIYFFGLREPSAVGPTPAPEAGLVAYYPFDGDARDYSGNNNHGTNNGANFVSGIKGQALNFDGTDDYVRIPVNINPDSMPELTIVAWARSDIESRTIISHDNGGYDRTIAIDNRGGGLGWSVFSGTGSVLGFHPVTTGEWTFLAAVYDQDAETVTLYVNDAVYEERGRLSNGWDYAHIGSNPSYGGHFDGIIDEVRIYNSALSQSEINSLRDGITAPAPTPTVEFTGLIFESRSKASGSSVQIPLTLNGIRENIGNMDMTLRYDSSVLEATEVIKGGLTSDSLFDYNIIDGTIRISLADRDGFIGDGSIAHVRFDVIGAEGSSSPLDIVSLSANRAEDMATLSIPTRDGVFTVISLEGSRGDAAGDGGVLTALDALYALQMAVGKIPEDLAMDMNGDGSVTSIDARLILQMAVESK